MFKEMFQETDKRLQAAQATIADLQGQLKEMTESQKRCWNEWTLAEQNVESLQQRVAQLEALKLGKEVGACEHCLYCVWESCAPDVPNAIEMKCSNGSTWWRCGYCRMKADYVRVLGLVQALPHVEGTILVHWSMVMWLTGAPWVVMSRYQGKYLTHGIFWSEDNATRFARLLAYRQLLPAQPAQGAPKHPAFDAYGEHR